MGNNKVKIPEGFVLEQPAIPEGFVLEEIPKTIYAQPVPPEEQELRGPQFRTTPEDIRPPYAAPEGTPMRIGPAEHPAKPSGWDYASPIERFMLAINPPVVEAVVGKVERTIKQFWNKGIVDVAHGLGESDNPALIKAYEIQRSRMSNRRKAGKRLHSSLLDDEFKDITWQLGLKPGARDDDDLKNISDVYPVGEDVNPFPKFNIPPGQDAGDYIADTVAGISSFVGQIYFLKKTLPGAPSPMIWEIQNVATGGKPGRGAAINTMLQAISHIPTTSVMGKGAKVVAGGGLFGGLTYAAGGDFTDIAVSTAIGAGFQAWDIHKQNQWLKSFKSHLKKAEYAKAQKAIAKGNKQAREVYQKDLTKGMKQVDANFEYQRNLREATRIGERMLKGIEPKIDKAMDVISRRLHHGKLTGKEGELATKIVERGLSPKVVAEVAGVKLPKTSGQELAKKGYSKTERLFKLKPAKGSPAARIEAGQTIQVVRNAEGSIRAYYPTEFKLDLPTGWTVGIESLPEAALKIRLQEVATQKAKEQETLLSEARAEAEVAEMDADLREIQRQATEPTPAVRPLPSEQISPPEAEIARPGEGVEVEKPRKPLKPQEVTAKKEKYTPEIPPAEPELTKKELRQREIEAETEEAGISPRRRNRLVKETEKRIAESDIYQAEAAGLETAGREIDVGFYYVPKKFRAEVEDIIGERKGFPTKLQKMFTFDPGEGALDWTKAVQEGLGRGKTGIDEAAGAMDITEFVQRVKEALEGGEKVGGLDKVALDRATESGDPYLQYLITKQDMLQEGRTVTEIDEMTKEWAEHYGLDEAEIENEFLGAEPLKLKEIKKLPEAEQETAIEALARENVLKQERQEAKQAVNDVLKANDIEVEVKEVAEIKEGEEIPFERRGKPTGAAIITPAGREIVQLAYGADSETGYHEAYHTLRRHLTPKDRKVLDMRFKGDQEAEAREFAEFAKTGKATGYLRGIWRKLVEKLKKIKSALQGRGYRTAQDIFGEIQRGVVPKEGAAPGATQFERGVFGQPIQEQLRLPLPERQAAIKKVAVQEAREKVAKKKAKPYEEWRPKGVVPIKTKLIKAVDAEIARTMKPRSNTVNITPEQIAGKLGDLFGGAELFYDPRNPLPEVTEAFAQLVKGGPLIQFERRPVFYSKLERVVSEKMPNKMQAYQFENWLKKQGIKREELDWSGLTQYLRGGETLMGKWKAADIKRTVTKQEILNTIAANNIQIEEVEKGDEGTNYAQERMTRIEFQLDNEQISERDKEKLRLEYKKLSDEIREKAPTKFQQYVLPGGERYRELLLRMPEPALPEPTVEQKRRYDALVQGERIDSLTDAQRRELNNLRYEKSEEVYKSGHWEETNVLAHVRFNERTDSEGKKVLFIEEIQSDWHQAGRRKGYKQGYIRDELSLNTDEEISTDIRERFWVIDAPGQVFQILKREHPTLENAMDYIVAEKDGFGGVPDAPFKKTWHELALKRMLRYAAENGYDKLAWTTGEQQAERYDLSKHVDEVGWNPDTKLLVAKKGGETLIREEVEGDKLDDYVGKEAAAKLQSSKYETAPDQTAVRVLRGMDLKVGGGGMKSFYDRMIPSFLNKYAKKWGARVGTTKIGTFAATDEDIRKLGGVKGKIPVPAIDITPSMKKSVMAGQVQFETSGDRMIRESMRNARIKAEKARIKASITPKARRGKLPIKIHDYTPVLSEALGKEPGALKKPRAETTKIKTQLEATAFLRDDLEPAKLPPAKPVELEKRVSTPKLTKRWFDENVGKEPLQIMAKISRETKEIADDVARAVWSSSLRLENIHPELMRRMREYCYRWMKRTAYMLEDAEPFLKKFKKLRHTNFKDWKALDLALKNSQGWMAEGIAAKHGMSEEYNTVRGLYDEIADMWDQVGGDLNRRADYWHREIKDSKGFLKHFYDSEHWSAIEQALKNRARRAGRDVADLTDEEKAQVINTLLRGYRTQAVTLATPGAVKERLVPVVDKEIDKYYYDSDVALVRYIREMNQAISQKEFFGRETRLVNKLRAQQSRRLSRLIKLKNRQGLKPGTTEVQYKEKIAKATEEWKAGQERLERLRTRDLTETIGGYVGKLKDQGMLSAEQERTVQRIIRGILQPKGMGRKTGLITTGIYIDTLNSFFQALTQLDEYAYSVIMSPTRAIPAGIRTIARKNRVKMRDIAVVAPGVEFEDKSLRKSLSQLLLVTTFRGIDVFGKESLINTALSKYEADARRKTLKPKFVADMKRVFGPEYKTVIEDLKRGEITENVNYLLFNVAADRQPIAYSEMPEMYNTGGNARILYTLKTFYLARLSYVRREAFNDMKHAKTFHQGFGKLLWIVGAFAALGVGSDALKDFLKGKTFDFADSVWNNVLNFIMWSKYSQYKAETEGIGRTVGEKLVPPTKAIDAATKDVVTIARDKDRGFEIWRSVPIVGEPYYWWFGRGREKIEAKEGKGWSEATE